MKEFLQDYMYSREYEIQYDDIDSNHEMTATSVFKYLEDAALAHSAYIGYTLDRFIADKNVWILIRWSMEMTRYPHFGDRITVETWAVDFSRFRATRNFRLKDEQGEVLGGISSQWIFFDLSTRRPAIPTEEMIRNYGTNPTCALTFDLEKLQHEGPMTMSKTLEVRRSDMDAMHHVNNKRYVEWMSEAVPEDIFTGKKIRKMEIAYAKEAYAGDVVVSGCAPMEDPKADTCYYHQITSPDGQTVHANGKTYWT